MNQHPDDCSEDATRQSLVALVVRIVHESGNPPGFDAAAWTAEWLSTENAALGGRAPEALLGTPDGVAVVRQLIMQMQSGAYA